MYNFQKRRRESRDAGPKKKSHGHRASLTQQCSQFKKTKKKVKGCLETNCKCLIFFSLSIKVNIEGVVCKEIKNI